LSEKHVSIRDFFNETIYVGVYNIHNSPTVKTLKSLITIMKYYKTVEIQRLNSKNDTFLKQIVTSNPKFVSKNIVLLLNTKM